MTNIVFSAGRPTFDWRILLDSLLDSGTFNVTDNSPQPQLILASGNLSIVIDGTDLTANGPRNLTGGTYSALTLISGGQTIATFNGFSGPQPVSELQTVIDLYDAPVYDNAAVNAALDAIMRTEALVVTGSSQGESVFGSLVGGDLLELGDGDDDVLVGAGATSHYDGGNGFDMIAFASTTVGATVDLDGGEIRDGSNALLATIENFEGVTGTTGNDLIISSQENGADHFFSATTGNDTYQGSDGEDSYTQVSYQDLAWRHGVTGGIVANLMQRTVVKAGSAGTDSIHGITAIRGTDYADTFIGDGWDNEFRGMNGVDSYSGGAGSDLVRFETETNQSATRGVFINLSSTSNTGSATGFTSTVTLSARTGLDAYGNLETFDSIERITGTRFNDRIIGDEKDNVLRGREGNDTMVGGSGRDRLEGDDGNDYLDGGSGRDDLNGGRGSDTLLGGSGNDNLDGGEGNDTVKAGSGEFDYISGSSGTDTVDGEAGYDMYTFDRADNSDTNGDGNSSEHGADSITVNLGGGIGAGTITGFYGIVSTNPTATAAAVSTTFSNLERIRGTVGADVFNVNAGLVNTEDANTAWSDIVRGAGGVFELVGGDGGDTFNDTARTGLTLINYDEEKWTHPDFDDNDGRRWGDLGEAGVAVNASNTTRAMGAFGNVAGNRAVDTWGDLDILNGVNAFKLTDADDYFYGGSVDAFVVGRDGNDNFNGGNGNDEFRGDEGNDTGRGGAGHDRLYGGRGDDVLRGDAGNDEIGGGDGDDTLSGDSGNDRIWGDQGNDTINGNDGRDNLEGGDGSDIIDGGNGNDEVRGDSDNDTVRGGAGDDQVEGGDGDDFVYGDAGDDQLRGDDGDDTVVGGLDDDEIEGGDGNDTLYGDDETSNNVLGGADRIWAGSGNDIVFGGYGGDQIEGEDGQDTLNGGFGDDRIHGGSDADTLNGDDGEDQLFGDDGNDTINGGNHGDLLDGGDNDDILNGDAGNDELRGGSGNDTLDGGSGADILIGGDGNDVYILGAEATGVDSVWDSSGIDTITSTITRKLVDFSGIENLTLLGTSGVSGTGDSADNVITGNSGSNTLNGGLGNDTLIGNGGNDVMIGGDGDDILAGGVGRDTLTGGLGNDAYDFNDVLDFGNTTTTRDILTEFSKVAGNQDLIDLHDVDADSVTEGNQDFIFIATKGAAFNGVHGALIWSQVDAAGTADDRTIIRADLDGDLVADIQFHINGLVNMAESDFLL